MKFQIVIMQKRQTVNPADKTIKDALHQMGYMHVEAVHLGKILFIEFDNSRPEEERRQQVEGMCKSASLNLVNPVMEDFKIEIVSP